MATRLGGLTDLGSARIEGADDLARVLNELPRLISDAVLTQSVRAGANVLRRAMEKERKARGWELDGGFKTKKRFGRGKSVSVVVAPPKDAFYVMFHEFGTVKMAPNPIMRPVVDAKGGEAVGKIGEQLGKKIESEATRLAGSFGSLGRTRRRRLARS